uniref:B-cell receptor CD22 first Ig-like domain-containing protein n=1 Tax=Salmo trutta TaxID=8032 RepID=A0A674CKX1_SALTR
MRQMVVILILSSCISGQNCWSVTYTHQRICALKGSTVDISCSYTYPSYHQIKTAFWFTEWESGMDAEDLSSVPGYEGHIEYLGDNKSDCTLRITDLRLSDIAGYRFRFITSGEKIHGSTVSLAVIGNLSLISHITLVTLIRAVIQTQ